MKIFEELRAAQKEVQELRSKLAANIKAAANVPAKPAAPLSSDDEEDDGDDDPVRGVGRRRGGLLVQAAEEIAKQARITLLQLETAGPGRKAELRAKFLQLVQNLCNTRSALAQTNPAAAWKIWRANSKLIKTAAKM